MLATARRIAVLLVAAAAVASSRGASGQEAPPVITVRPSGVLDEGNEARRRQERLLRRLEQSEYQFRSICRVCGSPERFEVATPFEPYRALAAPARQPPPPAPAVAAPEDAAALAGAARTE